MGLVEQQTKEVFKKSIVNLRRGYTVHTITFNSGKEFAAHEEIAQVLDVETYFIQPYAFWERGTNENTNGLIFQYDPKNTDFGS